MKALTLTQPWASLVALGAKTYETRSWATSYRGPLVIHAAKGLGPVGGRRGLAALCDQPLFRATLGNWTDALSGLYAEIGAEKVYGTDGSVMDAVPAGTRIAERLPLGAFVAVCDLIAVYPCDVGLRIDLADGRMGAEHEAAFGDFGYGRYAWELRNIRPLCSSLPCRGALGLWNVPAPEALALAADGD